MVGYIESRVFVMNFLLSSPSSFCSSETRCRLQICDSRRAGTGGIMLVHFGRKSPNIGLERCKYRVQNACVDVLQGDLVFVLLSEQEWGSVGPKFEACSKCCEFVNNSLV